MRPIYLLSYFISVSITPVTAQRGGSTNIVLHPENIPGTCRTSCESTRKVTVDCENNTNSRVQGQLEDCVCGAVSSKVGDVLACGKCIQDSSGGREKAVDNIVSVCKAAFATTSAMQSMTTTASGTHISGQTSASRTTSVHGTTSKSTPDATTHATTIPDITTTPATTTSASNSNVLGGQASQTTSTKLPGAGVKDAVPIIFMPALMAVGMLGGFGLF